MSTRLATTLPCPSCGYEFLHVENRLVTKPMGTYSLAGVQTKVAAYEWPHIVCAGCGISAPAKRDDEPSSNDDPGNVRMGLARADQDAE